MLCVPVFPVSQGGLLLISSDDNHIEMSYSVRAYLDNPKAIVNHLLHYFTNAASEGNGSIVFGIAMIFLWFWKIDNYCFSPSLREI